MSYRYPQASIIERVFLPTSGSGNFLTETSDTDRLDEDIQNETQAEDKKLERFIRREQIELEFKDELPSDKLHRMARLPFVDDE